MDGLVVLVLVKHLFGDSGPALALVFIAVAFGFDDTCWDGEDDDTESFESWGEGLVIRPSAVKVV